MLYFLVRQMKVTHHIQDTTIIFNTAGKVLKESILWKLKGKNVFCLVFS